MCHLGDQRFVCLCRSQARVIIKTWPKPQTAHEKSLAPRENRNKLTRIKYAREQPMGALKLLRLLYSCNFAPPVLRLWELKEVNYKAYNASGITKYTVRNYNMIDYLCAVFQKNGWWTPPSARRTFCWESASRRRANGKQKTVERKGLSEGTR